MPPLPIPDSAALQEYEQATVEASTVYRVDLATEQLEPLEEGWGLPPRHMLLKPDLVLVFDFGSEVPLPAPFSPALHTPYSLLSTPGVLL